MEISSKRRKLESSPDYDSKNAGTRGDPSTSSIMAKEPAEFEEVRKNGMLLWEKMTTLRDPTSSEGRYSHHDFVELPSRSEYADYYEIIKKPMSYSEIKQKLDRLEYSSIYEVRADFNQIFVNAKRYNAPGSYIFADAKRLHKLMKEFYSILTGEIEPPEEDDHPQSQQQHHQAPVRSHHANPNPPPPIVSSETVNAPAYVPVPEPLPEDETPTAAQTQAAIDAAAAFAKRGPTLKPWLTKKLGELRALKDSSGRAYSDGFASLPDRKSWAEYYKVIAQPMSLDHVAAKVVKRYYLSIQQFVDDVSLTFTNALFFNEETSRIWKDARIMQHHFAEVMKEVPPHFMPPRKYNTAKRRAEVDTETTGATMPDRFNASYKKRSKREESGSQPPEGGNGQREDYGDSENEYEDDMYQGDNGSGDYGTSSYELPVLPSEGFGSPVQQSRSPSGTPGPLFNNNSPFPQPAASPRNDVSMTPHTVEYGPLVNGVSYPINSSAPQPFIPSNLSNSNGIHPPLSNLNGNGNHQTVSSGNIAAITSSSPKTRNIAKVASKLDPPSISRFLVQNQPSTFPLTLTNDLVRQHSFSIPSTTERVDFTPFFRRLTNSNNPTLHPPIKLSVKPSGTRFESLTYDVDGREGGGNGGVPNEVYSLLPGPGLTIVEISLGGPGTGREKEIYRIFVTK